ncbi:MAG: hypothetical protein NW208_02815 [Bryobacter sp.]|nr:hypothetical protein [Bryobacter sp.]
MAFAARSLALLVLGCAALPLAAQIGGGAGVGGFGGPAVLGRGSSGAGARAGEFGFRVYAGVNYLYDTGLTGFGLDTNGNVLNSAAQGVEGVAGIYGAKRNRRSYINLNYQAGYRQYNNLRGFNGTDQNITLQYSKQVNARQAVGIGVNAGTTNRAFGIGSLAGFVDPNFVGLGLPTAEVFDNRIYYGSGSVNYIWQRTARSSVSFSGAGFATRRTGNVLFGVNGANASADYAYRLSRNQTINIGYNFLYFNFTRGFGNSQGHGMFVGYATKLARKYDLSMRFGGLRMQNLFLQQVDVDPVIAAIVGISQTTQVANRSLYVPTGAISFSGPVTRRSSFSVSAGLFATPGNGVITTSRNWNAGASYSYTGLRRVGLSGGVFYNNISSFTEDRRKFETVGTYLSVAPRLTGDFHWGFNIGTRSFLSGTVNNFRRNSWFFSTGLYWSPGELPLNVR